MPPGTKSVTRSSAATDDIQDVARTLCAEPVRAISEIRRGGNSRIFRVETRAARYALKKYPAADNRNRLEAEVNALRFMERKGIGRTPQVVAVSPERRFALLTWIDGEAVDTVTDADVAEFAAFQIALDARHRRRGPQRDRRGLGGLPVGPADHVADRAALRPARGRQARRA